MQPCLVTWFSDNHNKLCDDAMVSTNTTHNNMHILSYNCLWNNKLSAVRLTIDIVTKMKQ